MSKIEQSFTKLEPNQGRRRVPRRPIQKRVGILVLGEYHVCYGYEIGEGGMLVDSVLPMAIGQKLVLTIRIPGSIEAVSLASVMYIKEANTPSEKIKYGVSFENVDFEIKRQIRNFVASNTSKANII
jgi:hypothetical protein